MKTEPTSLEYPLVLDLRSLNTHPPRLTPTGPTVTRTLPAVGTEDESGREICALGTISAPAVFLGSVERSVVMYT